VTTVYNKNVPDFMNVGHVHPLAYVPLQLSILLGVSPGREQSMLLRIRQLIRRSVQ
jgi:hypothetical protein